MPTFQGAPSPYISTALGTILTRFKKDAPSRSPPPDIVILIDHTDDFSRGVTPFTPGARMVFELRVVLADAPDGAPHGSEFCGTPHGHAAAWGLSSCHMALLDMPSR